MTRSDLFGEDKMAELEFLISGVYSWKARSEAYLDHLTNQACDEVVIVGASDKIHNLQSTIEDYREVGDDIWLRFSTKSCDDQVWWYTSILQIITERDAPDVLTARLRETLDWLREN